MMGLVSVFCIVLVALILFIAIRHYLQNKSHQENSADADFRERRATMASEARRMQEDSTRVAELRARGLTILPADPPSVVVEEFPPVPAADSMLQMKEVQYEPVDLKDAAAVHRHKERLQRSIATEKNRYPETVLNLYRAG